MIEIDLSPYAPRKNFVKLSFILPIFEEIFEECNQIAMSSAS